MRIAILGTRGVPASYGGFETFAEELGWRLVARGHEVTVYGRRHYVSRGIRTHRGIRIVNLPAFRHKYLDTVSHTLLSTAHALFSTYEIVLLCNAANAVFAPWPRLRGTRVVLNVDGIERHRRKWNALGRAWYRASERLATWLPDAIVTDARVIQKYYLTQYRCQSTFIPYGSDLPETLPAEDVRFLASLGLESRRYFLYVSRLEPENNAAAVIAGFQRSDVETPLVIVGDAPYAAEYVTALRNQAGPRVIFTGGIYGRGYYTLQRNAFAYIHATEVGGTHPALVEAMGAGNCVIVHDAPENREVAADVAFYFRVSDPATLAAILEDLSRHPGRTIERGRLAAERARHLFSWDHVTGEYERLFRRIVQQEAS